MKLVDIARLNNKKYQNNLKKKRRRYKSQLHREIKEVSRKGETPVITEDTGADFVTLDYLENDLKPHFENQGFEVELRNSSYGFYKHWLVIRW